MNPKQLSLWAELDYLVQLNPSLAVFHLAGNREGKWHCLVTYPLVSIWYGLQKYMIAMPNILFLVFFSRKTISNAGGDGQMHYIIAAQAM